MPFRAAAGATATDARPAVHAPVKLGFGLRSRWREEHVLHLELVAKRKPHEVFFYILDHRIVVKIKEHLAELPRRCILHLSKGHTTQALECLDFHSMLGLDALGMQTPCPGIQLFAPGLKEQALLALQRHIGSLADGRQAVAGTRNSRGGRAWGHSFGERALRRVVLEDDAHLQRRRTTVSRTEGFARATAMQWVYEKIERRKKICGEPAR